MRDYDLWIHDPDYLSTGLTIMGWKDQRKVTSDTLRYVFSKEFSHEDAATLWNTAFNSVANPATHGNGFNPAFTLKVREFKTNATAHHITTNTKSPQAQVLQRINDNQAVLHRVMYAPHMGGIVHVVELLSRVQREDQYLVYGQALTNTSLHDKFGSNWNWSSATKYLSFTPLGVNGDEGCLMHMGGHMQMLTTESIAYWMMEVFFTVLRYESMAVAPIFALREN